MQKAYPKRTLERMERQAIKAHQAMIDSHHAAQRRLEMQGHTIAENGERIDPGQSLHGFAAAGITARHEERRRAAPVCDEPLHTGRRLLLVCRRQGAAAPCDRLAGIHIKGGRRRRIVGRVQAASSDGGRPFVPVSGKGSATNGGAGTGRPTIGNFQMGRVRGEPPQGQSSLSSAMPSLLETPSLSLTSDFSGVSELPMSMSVPLPMALPLSSKSRNSSNNSLHVPQAFATHVIRDGNAIEVGEDEDEGYNGSGPLAPPLLRRQPHRQRRSGRLRRPPWQPQRRRQQEEAGHCSVQPSQAWASYDRSSCDRYDGASRSKCA